ncbi:MAG TPA: hypothetical protein VMI31_13760, partial [Fimbriimonadaceae bacterium]|nr:hypothetical protein [Fimbriimonadaceae bacterium]
MALDALAACLRATVSESGERITIARSEKELDQARKAEASEVAENLKARLEESAKHREDVLKDRSAASVISDEIDEQDRESKQIQSSHEADGSGMSPFDGRELLPAEVLLEDLAKKIGPERLAADASKHPQVLEDVPAFDSLTLPACDALLADYNASMARLRELKPSQAVQSEIAASPWTQDDYQAWTTASGSAKHLRLRLATEADFLTLSLECFDPQGNLVDRATLQGIPLSERNRGYLSTIQRAAAVGPKHPAVDLSEDASWPRHHAELDPANLPKWIRDPDKSEPLDLFVEPALDEIAREDPGACVAIDVSDDLWYDGISCITDKQLDVDMFEAAMVGWQHYEHLNLGPISVWRPKYFDHSDASLADRAALSRYAAVLAAFGNADTRSRSVLYYQASPIVGTLTVGFASYKTKLWQEDWTLSDCLARLIGAISDEDWSRLLAGRR